jgi:hypothetical protein
MSDFTFMLDNRRNVKHNETLCASHFMLGPRRTTIIDLTGFYLFPILTCAAILRFIVVVKKTFQ